MGEIKISVEMIVCIFQISFSENSSLWFRDL